MKPLLAIDISNDNNSSKMNGGEFLIQKPSLPLAKSLDNSSQQVRETFEKSKLLMPFRIGKFICGMTALLIIYVILKTKISFEQVYQNTPWLFWVAGICVVVWVILWIWGRHKTKSVLGTEENIYNVQRLDKVIGAIYKELDVPDDAKTVDVLSFHYKIKDGEIKVVDKKIANYLNVKFKIFTDDKNLYLAVLEGKFAIPLTDIVKIHTVDKTIRLEKWNKREGINSGVYKQYKLKYGENGSVHCKRYHILEINHNGEIFGLYFPCYELPVFEEYIK